MTQRVILLHGIWMVGATMQWFASQLRALGYEPEIFGYNSIVGGPDEAASALAARLRDGEPSHIVAHSLGGLVALQALADVPGLPVRRVVCLGVPISGSAAAERMAGSPIGSLWLGRSADLLQAGCMAWPTSVDVGMVAGNLPHGLGALVAAFDGEHDGTVAVSETRASRLADHVVVAAGHSGLIFSADAVRRTDAFLRSGRFAPPA